MMSWSESLSTMTRGKAQAAGEIGRRWLTELDGIIASLERDWRIEVTRALDGGSHAFVGEAVGQGGEAYVLKAELPDNPTEEFLRSAAALRLMDGKGYCRLYACDGVRRAALLERLGEPLSRSGLPPDAQMRIICAALRVGWDTPCPGLEPNAGGYDWFRRYIPEAYGALSAPCRREVVDQALERLCGLERRTDPSGWVMVHGDAHNNNMLRAPGADDEYKLIDPDGILFERSYDVGVLMREWPDEYAAAPLAAGRARCAFLSALTGVSEADIWDWGFLQMTATALILLQIGQAELGQTMLRIAEKWTEGR